MFKTCLFWTIAFAYVQWCTPFTVEVLKTSQKQNSQYSGRPGPKQNVCITVLPLQIPWKAGFCAQKKTSFEFGQLENPSQNPWHFILKKYFLLKKGVFQCHANFQGCTSCGHFSTSTTPNPHLVEVNSTKLPGSNHPIENLKRAAGPGCVPGVSYPQPPKKLNMTVEKSPSF